MRKLIFVVIGIIIVGIVVVVLPVIGWFAWRGGLSSLWEVYVCYNVQYAKAMQSGKGLFSIASSRAFWPVMAAVVANIWWVYICGEGGRWNIARLNLLFLFASFTLILASGGSSRYYGPVLPACVLPLCFLIDRLKCSRMMAFCGMMGCVLCIGALVFARHNGNVERMKYVALRRMGEEAGVVGSNSVIVLGCDCYAYKTLDAWCPSRFVFQGTIGRCSERYRSDIIKEIDSGKIRFIVAPKNVLTTPGHLGTTWAKDAVEHSYRRLSSNEDYDIWVCKDV